MTARPLWYIYQRICGFIYVLGCNRHTNRYVTTFSRYWIDRHLWHFLHVKLLFNFICRQVLCRNFPRKSRRCLKCLTTQYSKPTSFTRPIYFNFNLFLYFLEEEKKYFLKILTDYWFGPHSVKMLDYVDKFVFLKKMKWILIFHVNGLWWRKARGIGLPTEYRPNYRRGPGFVAIRSLTALKDRSSIPNAGNNSVGYLSLNQIGLHWWA